MTWEQLSLFTDEELGIKPEYRIIGLTGYAQTGKDTVASILVDDYGYTRVAFADKIRDFLYAVNPLVACSPSGYLQGLVDLVGWDKAKQEIQVRTLLQNVGVSARTHLGDDVWINAALNTATETDRLVITDVRFLNEAEAIKQRGGVIWRVMRPGVQAVNQHVSETQMDSYVADKLILNSGTIEDLETLLKAQMNNAITK